MTENEAIKVINDKYETFFALSTTNVFDIAMATAIKTLEEIQQYRAIGTVEDIQKVLSFLGDENKRSIIDDLKLLNEYKDAEEEGLLVKLPCKIGSTLYQPINSHINEYKVIGLAFDIFQNKWMYEVAYEIVEQWYKTVCDFEVIGKTVFLTKEEAEKALAEMKAGGIDG